MNAFIRSQTTPVITLGATYDGTWHADALAAATAVWDGSKFALTLSIWDTTKGGSQGFTGEWASAFFTSSDLVTWTYIANSLLIPPVGKYIYGNSGFAWFNNAYWLVSNQYGQYDDPATIPVQVQHSTDLINWTIVNAAVLTGYADPALVVNPNNGKLELWAIDAVARTVLFMDSSDGVTWANHGTYFTSSPWNATAFGTPNPYYNGAGRYMLFDGATSDVKRFTNRAYSAASDTSWVSKGSVLGASPFNSWENVQVFDAAVIQGTFNLGQGSRLYLIYAGGDVIGATDNTHSSIGLAWATP